VIGLCLVAALVVPSLLTPGFLRSEILTYVLATILILVALAPVVVLWRRGQFEFCDVSLGVIFSYLMHFAFGALLCSWFGSRFISAQPGEPQYSLINAAAAASILGLVSMYVAYFGKAGAKFAALFRSIPKQWDPRRVPKIAFGGIVLGYGIRMGLMIGQAGSIGEFLTADKDALMRDTQGITYLAAFSSLATLGLLSLLIGGRLYKDVRLMRFFWITLPFDILFRFFSGSRSSLVFLLLGIVVAFYLTSDRTRSQNRRYAILCGFAMLLSIALFPLTTALRFAGASANPLDLFQRSPQLQSVAGFTYFIGERFHGVQSLALLMDRVPRDVPYNYSAPLLLTSVAWVPRGVWKDKPEISLALTFNSDILPPGLFPKNAAVALTIPGEYYWAFGVPGILVGMFLFGLTIRALQNRVVAPHHSATGALIAATMTQTFIQGIEQDTGYLITFGLVSYLVALGFGHLLSRGVRQ
jgi:hypothetical protein